MPDHYQTRLSLSSCDRYAIDRGQAFLLAVGCCAGSMAMTMLLDPRQGRRRRALLRDQSAARVRRAMRGLHATWRSAVAGGCGMSRRISQPAHDDRIPHDETLRQRVESQLFRDRQLPKGDLNISAEN